MAEKMFGKKVIDQYFLEATCPYTKRRPIKMKTVYWGAGITLTVFIVGVIFFADDSSKKEPTAAVPDYSGHSTITSTDSVAGSPYIDNASAHTQASRGGSFGASVSGIGYGGGGMGGGSSTRNHSANQVIRRGENGSDPGSRLPMGQAISARLINETPVIAVVTEDVFTHGTLSIPQGARAMGDVSYDESSHKAQLRFHTFVYPDGDQHPVQAIGTLAADYHSEGIKRELGKFLGHFIGGMADGMKERQASGQYGSPYEPGSIRNGVLNGVTLSAEDQAKHFSDDLSKTKPTMSLPSGQNFILFLEKEYLP